MTFTKNSSHTFESRHSQLSESAIRLKKASKLFELEFFKVSLRVFLDFHRFWWKIVTLTSQNSFIFLTFFSKTVRNSSNMFFWNSVKKLVCCIENLVHRKMYYRIVLGVWYAVCAACTYYCFQCVYVFKIVMHAHDEPDGAQPPASSIRNEGCFLCSILCQRRRLPAGKEHDFRKNNCKITVHSTYRMYGTRSVVRVVCVVHVLSYCERIAIYCLYAQLLHLHATCT